MKPAVSRVVSSVVTSNTVRDAARSAAALRRRITGSRPVVDYFHQIDDPYSHLMAQLLAPLAKRYGVRIRPWLVPPPADSAAPERQRLREYGVRDAARVAAEYGLSFPDDAALPDPDLVALAGDVLAPTLRTNSVFAAGRCRRRCGPVARGP